MRLIWDLYFHAKNMLWTDGSITRKCVSGKSGNALGETQGQFFVAWLTLSAYPFRLSVHITCFMYSQCCCTVVGSILLKPDDLVAIIYYVGERKTNPDPVLQSANCDNKNCSILPILHKNRFGKKCATRAIFQSMMTPTGRLLYFLTI